LTPVRIHRAVAMKVMAALAVLASAVAAGLSSSISARSAGATCKPGVTTVKGLTERVFCGPAKATVTIKVGTKAAKTYKFRNGKCDRFPKYFDANIGTVVLGATSKRKPPYFGLLMGKSPAATSEDPVDVWGYLVA
jgi:hypothetical protein